MSDPRRVVPPVRPVAPHENNEHFMRQVLAALCLNSEQRTAKRAYGEVVVKFTYNAGVITNAKIVEETTFKPEDRG